MADEGVHEIQLNGKQLVFMFMAVTVVAVVIFLCGVMVGRGVRTPRPAEAQEATLDTPADPTANVATSPAPSESPASGSSANTGSGTSSPDLTYSDRLSSSSAPPETLREPIVRNLVAESPLKKPASNEKSPVVEKAPVIERAPVIEKPVTAKTIKGIAAEASIEPKTEIAKKEPKSVPEVSRSGSGYVVQVAAVRARSEADTIAKRLASKGFPSFVTTPGPGAAGVYRVRVGKFTERKDAETIARRLEKEEQFKPWITR